MLRIEEIDAAIRVHVDSIARIESDVNSQNPPGSFWKYTPRARKKLDWLAAGITELMAEKRKLEGNPVPCSGYSGRQTNRR